MRILVIEDDARILGFVKRGLEAEGFRVDIAKDNREGIQRGMAPYDMIILDVLLCGNTGHEVCQALRREQVQTPILILTGKKALSDIIRGFDSGADDYVTKPFALKELLTRIKVLRWRKPHRKSPVELKVADLTLNRETREVCRGTKAIALTRKEFDLLECLMSNPNKALSRVSLLDRVWGYHSGTLTNVVNVYIGYLRKKVEGGSEKRLPREPLIQTVRDFGYKISEHRAS